MLGNRGIGGSCEEREGILGRFFRIGGWKDKNIKRVGVRVL